MSLRNPIIIEAWPPRLYVCDRRIHHVWVGLLVVLSDAHDWRVWVSDLRKRPR